MFKKLLSCLCAGFLALSSLGTAQEADVDMTDPYKMLTTVATEAFDALKANKDRIKTDVAFRKELIREKLLPYVDTAYAAYQVIGGELKNTSKEQRAAFVDAFAEYIVASYAEALGKYDDQELVMPAYEQVGSEEKMVNIKFLIRQAGQADLQLVFKVRKNNNTGEWKAYDMVAENISMLSAKQSELTPLIRQKGIDAVTQLLVEHNAQGSADPLVPEA